MPKSSPLLDAAVLVDEIARQNEVGRIVDTVLDGLSECFGYKNIRLLLYDVSRGVLITRGSRGCERTGTGLEVPVGDGLIGMVVSNGYLINAADMSDLTQPADGTHLGSDRGGEQRAAVWPSLPGPMSQIGIPMIVHGKVTGVLVAESQERFAFSADDQAVMTIVACQAGASLSLVESREDEVQDSDARKSSDQPVGRDFRVSYHTLDDSIFIDNEYLIKGVAGRLLVFMLDVHQREGRDEFTNRELRLSATMRMPKVKDNLDTRLLLLRRRLEDKGAPIRLVRIGRGRVRLQLYGVPLLDRVEV
ncbi:GAF domain-containing protein [Microvirga sp. 2MCAF35]|uniref:GAF domain-containing protein n=1 Tax=Microvirga sp. 2MCAF35 TaxID=3232987 RepID=UPI003F972C79